MDEIDALYKRIVAEMAAPAKRCKGHKPIVEIANGVPYWRCLLCDARWSITTGRREEGRGELS